MKKSEKAAELFSQGFNCAQSVFAVFAEKYGISQELALKIGCGFGGGMRNAEICGAVSGALMVLGLKYGHYIAEDNEQKSRSYAIISDNVIQLTDQQIRWIFFR